MSIDPGASAFKYDVSFFELELMYELFTLQKLAMASPASWNQTLNTVNARDNASNRCAPMADPPGKRSPRGSAALAVAFE